MRTDRITVRNNGEGTDAALAAAERFGVSMGLARKEQFHLRLLVEETLGMVRSIVEDFTAQFWLDGEDRICRLHLEARAKMDFEKRQELLSVSTDGKNTASHGFMARVRDLIEAGLYGMEESMKLQARYGGGMLDYGMMGMPDSELSEVICSWSMQKYRDDLQQAAELSDDLEKSIVAHIADDVQVGVRKDSVELVIIKNFKL